VKRFTSAIIVALALGPLSGCDNGDVRERTYYEVGCPGTLVKHDDKYECASERGVTPLYPEKSNVIRKVMVNRRTGTVAFDGSIVGECRVADFDAWECAERVPTTGSLGDIIQYRNGLRDGGYLEQWCNVSHGAPAVRSAESCKGDQRYYGIPVSDIYQIRIYLREQLCSTPHDFCKWL
jgi:hypothetical protein